MAVIPFIQMGVSMPASSTVLPSAGDVANTRGLHVNIKKPGFFQGIQSIKAIKKYVKGQGKEGEKPSKLARLALMLFIGSFAGGFLGQFSLAIAAIFGVGFIASIVLACIVLVRKDNPKSRKIARLILTIGGIALVGTVILVVSLMHFLNQR